jgi:uncharacterized protein with von Willebrand factor type A (vWA) domain
MRHTKLLWSLLLGSLSSQAMAYTECQSTLQKIWVGDGGMVWLLLDNGGSAAIASTDPNREAALALATTALTTNRSIVIRYSANAVNCTDAGRGDFVGLYLLK